MDGRSEDQKMGLKIGIVGATGEVGRMMMRVLEERNIPLNELRLFASQRSAGKNLIFREHEIIVEELTEEKMKEKYDYLLFSAGASISKHFAPIAAKYGSTVIDNSSAFRMEKDILLVVPEVNAHVLDDFSGGIIANPNCSTIQMVVALAPIHRRWGIERIVVSTYQAVSGAGRKAIRELAEEVVVPGTAPDIFPKKILFNCIPHIGGFKLDLYTTEEHKMIDETHKIMGDNSMKINVTTVRVPVVYGHSESIYAELREEAKLSEIKEELKKQKNCVVLDEPFDNIYPTPLEIAGKDEVFVGRLRKDLFDKRAVSMWVVADNIRKGAATNAVQILEYLISSA